MNPLFASLFGNRKPLTRQQNLRAFRVVFLFLAAVVVIYSIVAFLVFGHL
jgi:hypothetical protein